jgi:hypothetical protein
MYGAAPTGLDAGCIVHHAAPLIPDAAVFTEDFERRRAFMDLLIVVIVLLLLFGGGGGLYWGLGMGWGIGPIGLILAVLIVAFVLNGYRGRRL